MSIAVQRFDVLDFIDKLTQVVVERKVAEVQARELEHIQAQSVELISNLTNTVQEQKIEIDSLKAKEPATKKDLEITKLELQKEIEIVRKEIEIVRKDTLKFVVWTGVGIVFILGGMLAKGFGWF